MTQEQKRLFDKLSNDRMENARVIEKTSMRGTKDSVVEKYSDQAHFIYELIQNADDAEATKVSFILLHDRLVFIHNGKRHFSVTDVDHEQEDTDNGTLGDLNAITSIANSNKTTASIGKFGVGFKSVFQYTTTPHIYDSSISFKIERFLVPVLIEADCQFRSGNNTVFVFPFNHPSRNKTEAFRDISNKLQNLTFPTLFLKHLTKIEYKIDNINGRYYKTIKDSSAVDNTKIEYIELLSHEKDRLWLFSRETADELQYSVGFFVDKNGKLLKKDYYAFCFFPTKKATNLSFIIQAPFLLTDSREGIKAADNHNIRMINLLAQLSADSLVYLKDIGIKQGKQIIDEDIISYIPYDEAKYIPKDSNSDISFLPFYEKIQNVLETEKILPSFTDYSYAKSAYMANAPVISDVFSNKQLSELVEDDNAHWVFPSIGWEAIYRTRDGRADYLREIIPNSYLIDTKIVSLITADFIKHQSIAWLDALYSFICETDRRIEASKDIPIFIDNNGDPAAAYDEYGNAILFLDDNNDGYLTISSTILQLESAQKLIERLHIGKPELKDRIYNKILKKETFDGSSDFPVLLDYYIQLKEQGDNSRRYINDIKDLSFVNAVSPEGLEKATLSPCEIYFADDNLKYYLKGLDDAWIFDVDSYNTVLTPKQKHYLDDFLDDLGVNHDIMQIEVKLDKNEALKKYPEETFEIGTRDRIWTEYYPHGIDYVLDRIVDNEDQRLSFMTWNLLCQYFQTYGNNCWIHPICGIYNWFYYSDQHKFFTIRISNQLKSKKWLIDTNEKWSSTCDLSVQGLSKEYDVSSEGAKRLIDFLGIKDEHPEYDQLSPELREKIELFDKLKSLGFDRYSEEDLISMTAWLSHQKRISQIESPMAKEKSAREKVIDELSTRVQKSKSPIIDDDNDGEFPTVDEDVNTPASVDYQKKIEEAKKKCEEEISKIASMEEAQAKVLNCKKYTYGWFTGLLELEAIKSGEDNTNSREVSISFSKIEPDETRSRTLYLKQPNRSIPQIMEQLVNIPMILTLKNSDPKTLIIEAVAVQSYSLQVIVKQDDWLDNANWESVTEISINTKNPSFLIRELQNEFSSFQYDENFNMQENLCDNISFVFGPPGTGKTTYIAKETLLPLVANNKTSNILVLTPTNKAADVITERIMEVMGNDSSYEDWLIRYGITSNQSIQESSVFYSRDVDFSSRKKRVVITTMARLPYDYFVDTDGGYLSLHDIDWDYVIVDEASMVPLYQMVYMFYRTRPKKFIISGDPFQIEPTVSVKEWKDENIYTMVNLIEFSEDVETKPCKYDIKLLTTQYRSIESVGEVFSQLTYHGVLKHARTDDEIRPLNIERFLGEYQSLNLIRFPVNQYEGIYRSKQLKHSNYQIYSALFAFEFSSYLAQALARCNNEDERFSIGIISPYGAQAGLIDKLLSNAPIPKSINITCGTIHGFQGDECDIIIALFNTPPSISTNEQMFLNRKNIINVAISRAKDYLFVLMPDDDTQNIRNLNLIGNLKGIIQRSNHKEYTTKELEELLFGIDTYLEDNSFATGHQSVNVYGEPEKRYEIRSEDSAIDVQVHGKSDYLPFIVEDEANRTPTEDEMKNMLIEQEVFHTSFKEGVIDRIEGNNIIVDFADGMHKFIFPDGLKTHLFLKDENVLSKFKKYIETI